jgi:hypothetical protein
MITFTKGDLFESQAEALVNAVNCVGVMGKGIAYQFKRRFPENFRLYYEACLFREVKQGKCSYHATHGTSAHRDGSSTFQPSGTGEIRQNWNGSRPDLKTCGAS